MCRAYDFACIVWSIPWAIGAGIGWTFGSWLIGKVLR